MNVSPLIQKIIVAVLVISALGYIIFNTLTGEVPLEEGVSIVSPQGEEILILADRLESINIDTDLFSSPLFTSLVDISVPIIEEPKGRPNPFAPIGNDSVSTGSVRVP